MMNLTDVVHWGVVEDRDTDPQKSGRCKVRVVGIHNPDKVEQPTSDLPWAYPLQPITSAAMSGIGDAAVGVVEGTWVMVVFRDADKQHPVMMGTVGGIPSMPVDVSATTVNSVVSGGVVDGSGQPVLDSSGNQVKSDSPPPVVEQGAIKKPGALSVTPEGTAFMQDNEALASLVPGRIKLGSRKTPNATKIHAYQDSGGVWTIGWGNTRYTNGSPVRGGDTITKAEADVLFDVVKAGFVANVNRDLKTPVTQSMFEALVDMSYNMGHAGLTKSSFWATLNSGNYESAAALIPKTRATVKGKPSEGLKNRREKERSWFLRDGIPKKDMTAIDPTPEKEAKEIEDATKNPAVRRPDQQTQGQDNSTASGASSTDERIDRSASGFQDPNKVYPRKEMLGEPDLNRLARHEKIDETIVIKKEAARVRGVVTARGATWSQPNIPYNSIYPFNSTRATESGHIEEWDDTAGNERIHRYHRTGTFEEIDLNGTKVQRIVGDNFEILERNGNVLIKGNCNVTVQGESRVRIENNAYIEVLGDAYTDVSGNMETSVKGDYKVKAASIQMEAYDGDIDISGRSGVTAIDASMIYLNSNMSVTSGLSTPGETSRGLPEFHELKVPDRSNEVMSNYETPEEGNSDEFIQNMVALGVVSPEDVKPQEVNDTKDEVQPEEVKEMPKEVPNKNCELVYNTDKFTTNFPLTKGWTLGDVCKGRSGVPNGMNYGRSAQEIVCNLKVLTENVIDPIKKRFPNLIITNSWRSEAVNNSLAGASKTSQHLSGEAVDIQFSGFNRKQTYEAAIEIQKMLPEYDQMLLEYMNNSMWLHVSFKASGGNRMQVKTIDVYNRKNNVNGAFKLYGG